MNESRVLNRWSPSRKKMMRVRRTGGRKGKRKEKRMKRLTIVSWIGVAISLVSHAGDWPQWLGPTRNGLADPSEKIADKWPVNGPKRLWKSAPIPSGKYGGKGKI